MKVNQASSQSLASILLNNHIDVPSDLPNIQISEGEVYKKSDTTYRIMGVLINLEESLPMKAMGLDPVMELISFSDGVSHVHTSISITTGESPSVSVIFELNSLTISIVDEFNIQLSQPEIKIALSPADKGWNADFSFSAYLSKLLVQREFIWDGSIDIRFNFEVSISNGEVTGISGSAFKLFHRNVTVLKLPKLLQNLQIDLSSLGASAGILTNPPMDLLGVQSSGIISRNNGQIKISNFALVTTIEGEPIPMYIAFELNELRLSQIARFLGFNFSIPTNVYLKQPKFIWSEETQPLPDGTVPKKGVSFSSSITVANLNVFGSFNYIDAHKFSGMIQLDGPIEIKTGEFTLFKLSGNGKQQLGSGNPHHTIPTNNAELTEMRNAPKKVLCKAGGVLFNIDTQSDTLEASAELTFLNVLITSLEIQSNLDNGIEASFSMNEARIVNSKYRFVLKNDQFVYIDFAISHELNFVLPECNIGRFLVNEFDISLYLSATKMTATVSFSVNDASLRFDYEINPDKNASIGHLVDTLIAQIIREVPTLVKKALTSPKLLARMVAQGVLIPTINNGLFAVEILKNAGVPIDEMADPLVRMQRKLGVTPAAIVQAISQLYGIKEVQNEVEDVLFEMTHLGASVVFSAENIAKALEATFGISIKDMATLLYTKGVDVMEAAASLKNVFGISADEVACVLEHANYPKEVIENAFHKLGGAFEHVYDEIVEHIFDWGLW